MKEISYGIIPILKSTNEILLVQSMAGKWGFPKGHPEPADKTKFVWLIGKPGSGKTTVGSLLDDSQGVKHFSFGQLLKEIQPNPSIDGYSLEDREKVNQIIINAGEKYSTVVVDGNPYSKIGLGFVDTMKKYFDDVVVCHLIISDVVALDRLLERNREVLIHDGASQQERIESFNTKLLPLIEEYKESHLVHEIDVNGKSAEETASIVQSFLA